MQDFLNILLAPFVVLGEAVLNAFFCNGALRINNIKMACGIGYIFLGTAALPPLMVVLFPREAEAFTGRLSLYLLFVVPITYCVTTIMHILDLRALHQIREYFRRHTTLENLDPDFALIYAQESVLVLEELRRNKLPFAVWQHSNRMMRLQSELQGAFPAMRIAVNELGAQQYTYLIEPNPVFAELYILRSSQSAILQDMVPNLAHEDLEEIYDEIHRSHSPLIAQDGGWA